jgi:HSP20 family protein
MELVKKQREANLFPTFSSIFDEFLGQNYMPKMTSGLTVPAVNIKEDDKAFTIVMAAPGLDKADFNIGINQQVLTISSEKKAEKEEKEEGKFTRREYSYSSFSRSFTLPNTIETDKIEATYENGELVITLPKMDKDAKFEKRIAIN